MPADTWVEEQVDDAAGGGYDRSLYRYRGFVPKLAGPLTRPDSSTRERYRAEGYLAVDAAFTAEQINSAREAVDRLISGAVPAFRGIQWEAGARARLRSMSPAERRDAVRKLIYFVDYEPRLRALAYDEQLLRIVTALLGDEPPEMFADQALLKPPGIGREKPWHQDLAFFDLRPGTPVVGVWIALDPTDPGNGCMHVIPGSHRGGAVVHFNRRDFQICDDQVDVAQVCAVPFEPGGALFFDGYLHHGTPANSGPDRRWALQFHYAPRSGVWRSPEERAEYKRRRLDMFGSDGKDVTC